MELQTDDKNQRFTQIRNVFIITMVLNLVVSGGELFWAYHTHTLSLMADGFHSLLDAASNVVALIGIYIAAKPPDPNHPYGHRKFEAFAAMIISLFIFLTFFEISGQALARLTHGDGPLPTITLGSYLIKLGGLGINLFVNRYETIKGKELQNELLLTDARHTMSDILVSISVLASMAMIQMGLLWMDVVIAGVISLIVLGVGYEVIMTHLGTLVDEAVLDPEEVRALVLAVPGVRGCHAIRSRGMRDNMFLDLHVQVPGHLTIKDAHQISYDVEAHLKRHYGHALADVLVHVEEEAHEVHDETGPLV